MRKLATAVAFLAALSTPALAEYPDRPIRFIVPYAPGGSTDLMGRVAAGALERELKVPVVVENRTGGGGLIGLTAIAKSAPDGYTIGLGGGLTLFPFTVKDMPFDPLKDLTYLSVSHTVPYVLAVGPSFKARSLKELVDAAQAAPGKMNYATASFSFESINFMMMKSRFGIDMQEVTYKGAAPMYQALYADEVQMTLGALGPLAAAQKDGKARMIAIISDQRLPDAPDLPTFRELGVPDLVAASVHFLAAPGTPDAITRKLSGALNRARQQPDLVSVAGRYGLIVAPPTTPEQTRKQMLDEVAKLEAVTKANNIKPQ
jgi:tripartite-type tricarboxylate transporter receptor subunit TctC